MHRAKGALNAFRGHMTSFSGSMKSIASGLIGLYAGRAFIQNIEETATRLNEINTLSRISGASPELLTGMKDAAGDFGLELGHINVSLRKFLKEIGGAEMTGKETIFSKLLIDFQSFRSLNMDAKLGVIADRIELIGDETIRGTVLTELFGKQGAVLAPLFEKGAYGLDLMRQQAEKFGLALSGEQSNLMHEQLNTVQDIKDVFEGMSVQLTMDLLPTVSKISEQLITWATAGDGIAGKMDSFTKTILGFTHGITAAVLTIGQVFDQLIGGALRKIEKITHFTGDFVKNIFTATSAFLKTDFIDPGRKGFWEHEVSLLDSAAKASESLRRNLGSKDWLNAGEIKKEAAIITGEQSFGYIRGEKPKGNINSFGNAVYQAELAERQDAFTEYVTEYEIQMKKEEEFQKSLNSKQSSLTKELTTPYDSYMSKIEDINLLFDEGRIGPEKYAEAVKKVGDEFKKSSKAAKEGSQAFSDVAFPLMSFGTTAGKFGLSGSPLADTPQVDVASRDKQKEDTLKQQTLDILRIIAMNTGKGRVALVG